METGRNPWPQVFSEFDLEIMVKQVDTDASTAGAPAVLTFIPALFLELMELIFFKIKKIFLNMMGGFNGCRVIKGLRPFCNWEENETDQQQRQQETHLLLEIL